MPPSDFQQTSAFVWIASNYTGAKPGDSWGRYIRRRRMLIVYR